MPSSANFALEALCINEVGGSVKQLARQLTAAALNCGVSGGSCDCADSSIAAIYNACDAACIAGQQTAMVNGDNVDCTNAIDCFNNGGVFDSATNTCKIGECIDSQGTDVGDCLLEDGEGVCDDQSGAQVASVVVTCVRTPGCHDRGLPDNLCDTEVEHCSASSSDACHTARENNCEIIPPAEAQCTVCEGGGDVGAECESSDDCDGGTCQADGLVCAGPETCPDTSCN
ncbi:MAG: hypothetical protein AB7N53_15770 [Candidatus Binatia bacterium]